MDRLASIGKRWTREELPAGNLTQIPPNVERSPAAAHNCYCSRRVQRAVRPLNGDVRDRVRATFKAACGLLGTRRPSARTESIEPSTSAAVNTRRLAIETSNASHGITIKLSSGGGLGELEGPETNTAPAACCSAWLGVSLLHRNTPQPPGGRRNRVRISSRRAVISSRSAANCLAPANSAPSSSASRPMKKVASAAVM